MLSESGEEVSMQNCDSVLNGEKNRTSLTFSDSSAEMSCGKGASVQLLSHGDSLSSSLPSSDRLESVNDGSLSSKLTSEDDVFHSDISSFQTNTTDLSEILRHYDSTSCDENLSTDSEEVTQFLSYLDEVGTPPDGEQSLELSIQSLDSLFSHMCSSSSNRTSLSIPKSCDSSIATDTTKSSHVTNSNSEDSKIESRLALNGESQNMDASPSISNPSSVDSKKAKCDGTTFEVIEDIIPESSALPNKPVTEMRTPSPQDATSFIDISMSHFNSEPSVQTSLSKVAQNDSTKLSDSVPRKSSKDEGVIPPAPRKSSKDEGFSKSVSFNLSPSSSMQSSSTMSQNSTAAVARVPSDVALKGNSNQPNIGGYTIWCSYCSDFIVHFLRIFMCPDSYILCIIVSSCLSHLIQPVEKLWSIRDVYYTRHF